MRKIGRYAALADFGKLSAPKLRLNVDSRKRFVGHMFDTNIWIKHLARVLAAVVFQNDYRFVAPNISY